MKTQQLSIRGGIGEGAVAPFSPSDPLPRQGARHALLDARAELPALASSAARLGPEGARPWVPRAPNPIRTTLSRLVSSLQGLSPRALTPVATQTLLSGTTLDEGSLHPYLSWRPGGYTRNQVFRSAAFEVLVLCWDRGSQSAIHDHSGQECWLAVHAGILTADNYRLRDVSHRGAVGEGIAVTRTEAEVRLGAHDVAFRDVDDDLHQIFNRRGDDARAVSLHVYARPHDTCTVYDAPSGRAWRKTMVYDTIGGRKQ